LVGLVRVELTTQRL